MARIRGPHPAGRLAAVERQSKGAKICAPKSCVEFLPQNLRFVSKSCSPMRRASFAACVFAANT
jgi:hypothetical protein